MFQVAEECLALGLRAGAIVFRDVAVGPRSPVLHAEIAGEAAAVRRRFADAAAIRASAEVRPFQDLLCKVGANPRRDQNSVERLLTFAFKRGDLPTINSLVDSYNLVSVRSGLSLGAHDLDRIDPPVILRFLTGTESFLPLGSSERAILKAGEFGYVDGQNRLLCRLDVLQADFSKVTEATCNVLLIVEGTAAHPAVLLHQTIQDVIAVVTLHCGGKAEVSAWPDGPVGPPIHLAR
jgi:DNA/RNA-binding domain of Phe-tRNA-synthetase-like protein